MARFFAGLSYNNSIKWNMQRTGKISKVFTDNMVRAGLILGLVPSLVYLLVSCYWLSQPTIADVLKTAHWAPYTISSEFTERETFLINHATTYFSQAVGCIKYVQVADTDRPNLVLKIKVMPKEKHHKGYVGLFVRKDQSIEIYQSDNERLLYKSVLHELGHASGMQGHAFPVELRKKSQLTPKISFSSEPMLYQRDVTYLKGIICGAPK